MKKIFTIFCLMLLYFCASAQEISVVLTSGYGTYQLKDFKKYQKDLIRFELPKNIESVEQFPNYFIHSVLLNWKDLKNSLVFEATYMTTGCRNHLKDYSGEYKLDMFLNGYKIGLGYKRNLISLKNLNIYAGCKGGVILSDLIFDYNYILYSIDTNAFKSHFKSNIFFAEPYLEFIYPVTKRISFQLNVGYEKDLRGKMYLKDDKDWKLTFLNGDPLYLNWSGIRSSIGVSYIFFQK